MEHVFFPSADTRIESAAPTENKSRRPRLYAGGHRATRCYRSLLRFDLPVDDPPHFGRAVLCWYQDGRHGPDEPLVLGLYGLREPWRKRKVNWLDQPGHDTIPAAELVAPGTTGIWLEFDATQLVRAWLQKARPNHGALIRAKDENKVLFSTAPSTNWPDHSLHPRLVLHPPPPPPPPPPPWPPRHQVVTRDFGTFRSHDDWRSTPGFDGAGLIMLTAFVSHQSGGKVTVRLSYGTGGGVWCPDPGERELAAGMTLPCVPLYFSRFVRLDFRSSRPGHPGVVRVIVQGSS